MLWSCAYKLTDLIIIIIIIIITMIMIMIMIMITLYYLMRVTSITDDSVVYIMALPKLI